MSQRAAHSFKAGPLPVVDLDHLQGFTDGDLALERELAELYLSSAGLYLERMSAALEDPEAWRRHAHALKGASGNLGAREVADLASRAEHRTADRDLLDGLEAAVARVRRFFEERRV